MVLRIAVVDDAKGFRVVLTDMVNSWCAKTRRDAQVVQFASGENFVFEWDDMPKFDAVFLDIKMPGMDGMEVAKLIRKTNNDIIIVFTTSVMDYVLEGYDVGAKRYLLKPIEKKDIFKCLDDLWDTVKAYPSSTYSFRWEGKQVRVPFRDIMYFENAGHYATLYTVDESYQFKINLRDLEKELPHSFVRCQRSFIVNMEYVYKMDSLEITLRNKKVLPVGKSRIAIVQREFMRRRKSFI